MWGGRALCRCLAVFLNFDITSMAIPTWVYLLDGVVALVIPLLAAAFPVHSGTRVSIRRALDDAGVGNHTFGTGAMDRLLARIGGPLRPVLLGARNSLRRRARLALTLAMLAVGGEFVMSAFNVRASMINTLDRLFGSRRFDLTVNLAGVYPWDTIEGALSAAPGIIRVEGWLTTQGAIVDPSDAVGGTPSPVPRAGHTGGQAASLHGGSSTGGVSVVALPAHTRLLVPDIAAGRSLRAHDTNALVANSALAARLPVGSEVTLSIGPARVKWRVVGHVREPFAGPVAYVPLEYLLRLGGHEPITNSLRLSLRAHDARSVEQARGVVDRALEAHGIRAVGSTSQAESRIGYDEHMAMIYVFLLIVATILLAVGGLGLATTASLNVLERRREMGVLRAIGATPTMVSAIVMFEGAVVGLASGVLAALTAWPAGRAIGSLLTMALFESGLDFRFDAGAVLAWLAGSVMLGAAASAVPAWRASRRMVRDAIAYE